jgi:hypothetical protein
MAGFSTGTNEHLIRSNIWSTRVKEVLEEDLMGMRYVDMITDFPDGDTINIPSWGNAEVLDYAEGQAVRYTAMDTGNFTFSITDYKSSATYVTEKMKQDSFYMNRLQAQFVPKMSRALACAMENSILSVIPDGQTAAAVNAINGIAHRTVGSGVLDSKATLAPKDFAFAKLALRKANVPPTNLIAIVDPAAAYYLETLTNIVNVSSNPHWEGVITSGLSTGMRFIKNIYGFDVYESTFLKGSMTETIASGSGQAGGTVTTNGVANLFFSAASDILPVVGNVRQPPKVDSSYNKDLQREEYVTTCRYGFKLFRPENAVVILSDSTAVA